MTMQATQTETLASAGDSTSWGKYVNSFGVWITPPCDFDDATLDKMREFARAVDVDPGKCNKYDLAGRLKKAGRTTLELETRPPGL